MTKAIKFIFLLALMVPSIVYSQGRQIRGATQVDSLPYFKVGSVEPNYILGRYTTGTGKAELIQIGSGLNLAGGVLTASGGGGGSVTSVGLIATNALSVSGSSPITSSGTFTLNWTGTTAQYIRGDGSLATFPVVPAQVSITAGTGISISGIYPNIVVSAVNNGTVTSVTAGNGMTFSTITNTGPVTLGTPGTITLGTTNAVQANSHTHAFNPGGTSSQYIRGDGVLATLPTGSSNNMANANLTLDNNRTHNLNNFDWTLTGNGEILLNSVNGAAVGKVLTGPGYANISAIETSTPNQSYLNFNIGVINISSESSSGYSTIGMSPSGLYLLSSSIISLTSNSSNVTVNYLGGGGNRMVAADNNGRLYAAPFPSGGGTVTQVAATISGALSVTGSPINNSGTLAFNWTGDASQYVRGDGTLATFGGGGGGVSSVAATVGGTALTVSGSPITSTGTLAFDWSGNVNQYVRGDGSLATLPGGTGTVTSIASTVGGNALVVSGSPITNSGTLAYNWVGNTAQYVTGAGTLASFPTIPAQLNAQAGANMTISGTYPNLIFSASGGGGGGGSVSSVGASITGNSINITGSPVTSTGTIAFTFAGNSSQYVRGDGVLTTFPTIPPPTTITAGTNIVISGTYPDYIINSTSGGGGSVSAVSAGNGMNFSTITGSGAVTMGTPSSITLSSSNLATTGTHTHAFVPGGSNTQYIRGDGVLTTFPFIPAQLNAQAGANMTISGTYPNLIFSASGGGTGDNLFTADLTLAANRNHDLAGFDFNFKGPGVFTMGDATDPLDNFISYSGIIGTGVSYVNSSSDGIEVTSYGANSANYNRFFATPTNVSMSTNGVSRLAINTTGTINVPGFTGTGTRMVVTDASGNLSTQTIGSGGTVTSVASTFGGNAVTVGGSPITTSGTLAYTWNGNINQYVRGDGTLATFPTLGPQTWQQTMALGNTSNIDAVLESSAGLRRGLNNELMILSGGSDLTYNTGGNVLLYGVDYATSAAQGRVDIRGGVYPTGDIFLSTSDVSTGISPRFTVKYGGDIIFNSLIGASSATPGVNDRMLMIDVNTGLTKIAAVPSGGGGAQSWNDVMQVGNTSNRDAVLTNGAGLLSDVRNSSITLSGGDGKNASFGGIITMYGNTSSGDAGSFHMASGQVANSEIVFYTPNNTTGLFPRFRVRNGGNIVVDGFAGGGTKLVTADNSGVLGTTTLASGPFTPTATRIAGTGGTLFLDGWKYIRIGNIVHVTGIVVIQSATNSQQQNVRITLPVASNLSLAGDISGSMYVTGSAILQSTNIVNQQMTHINVSSVSYLNLIFNTSATSSSGNEIAVGVSFMYQVK